MNDETMREAFESYARSKGWKISQCPEFPGEYDWAGVQNHWECWQAAINTRAQASAPEGVVWEELPERPVERQQFQSTMKLFNWSSHMAVLDALRRLWADAPKGGSYRELLAIVANDVAKLGAGKKVPYTELPDSDDRVAPELISNAIGAGLSGIGRDWPGMDGALSAILYGIGPLYTRSNAKAVEVDAFTPDEVASLANFAAEIMGDWPEVGGFDGYDLQQMAEKHGLLSPEERKERCGDACQCADECGEWPVTCYRSMSALKKAKTLSTQRGDNSPYDKTKAGS